MTHKQSGDGRLEGQHRSLRDDEGQIAVVDEAQGPRGLDPAVRALDH
ncbi:MAG: hypothetical protein WCP62_14970 [Planctomycetota bacterium]